MHIYGTDIFAVCSGPTMRNTHLLIRSDPWADCRTINHFWIKITNVRQRYHHTSLKQNAHETSLNIKSNMAIILNIKILCVINKINRTTLFYRRENCRSNQQARIVFTLEQHDYGTPFTISNCWAYWNVILLSMRWMQGQKHNMRRRLRF